MRFFVFFCIFLYSLMLRYLHRHNTKRNHNMAKTRHLQQRMSQRSIQQEWLDLVKRFGMDDGDKVVLNQRGIDCALDTMKKLATQLQKMRTRGGLVLVQEGDDEITTYSINSFQFNTKQRNNNATYQ